MSKFTDTMATVVSAHPRLVGAVFALCLALSQAGTVLAGNGGSAY